MRKKEALTPEVFRSSRATSTAISRMVAAGTARKIGPNLYTNNLLDEPEVIVSRNLWPTVGLFAPGTVISHRTAFENLPALDGSVFVTGDYTRNIVLPGLIIRQLQGPGPVRYDLPYLDSLYLASRPRYLLENLLPSRRRDKVPKTLGRGLIEQRLVDILRVNGEDMLNRIRDEARVIAPDLELQEQFNTLDQLIAALLRSRPAALTAPVARAYAAGEPFDPTRLPLFDTAFAELRGMIPPNRPDRSATSPAFHNVAFFDAYFSNYIEGTEFPVDQAIRIVFDNEIPVTRPDDAHDVIGTYRLTASREEMNRCPADFDDFLALLKRRHSIIMQARPSCSPGEFKTENNRAGNTLFVPPELVVGTLRQGYNRYKALEEPLARALFMMMLVTEVHPFADGNGRIARIMMNAELIAGRQTRIFIPSVYRNEYINSLKRLTNHHRADAFIRVMSQAQLFVDRIDFRDLQNARQSLAEHHAFHDPADDVRLEIPPATTDSDSEDSNSEVSNFDPTAKLHIPTDE